MKETLLPDIKKTGKTSEDDYGWKTIKWGGAAVMTIDECEDWNVTEEEAEEARSNLEKALYKRMAVLKLCIKK